MTAKNFVPQQPKKPSSVRHTRAIQRDRSKRAPAAPPDEQVAERLTELLRPAIFSTVRFYYDLGLRQRLLTLPIMVALVLTMIWRQVGAVRQLVHLLDLVVLVRHQERDGAADGLAPPRAAEDFDVVGDETDGREQSR